MEAILNLGSAMRCFERELDAAVNCEVLHPAFMESKALALAPDQYLHDTAFCRASKLAAGGICFANKARSKQIAALGRPFSGCCPNGVWDYAQPVIFEGRPAAVFYLGSFCGSAGAENGSLPVPGEERKREIRAAARFLKKFVLLELTLWQESRPGRRKKRDDSYYLEQCENFIERSYHLDPALSDLAEILRVHSGHLGPAIRRASGGRTFRELLTARRLKEAELLLRLESGRYSIGEIGRRCGFADSNYFSTVFRRHYGCAPRAFVKHATGNSE